MQYFHILMTTQLLARLNEQLLTHSTLLGAGHHPTQAMVKTFLNSVFIINYYNHTHMTVIPWTKEKNVA